VRVEFDERLEEERAEADQIILAYDEEKFNLKA